MSRRGNWVRIGQVLLVLALLLAVLTFLHHELRHYDLRDISRTTWGMPRGQILLALGLTVLAFLVLPGYDAIALAYAGHRLPAGRLWFGSTIAYGVSQTLGLPLLTGGSIRYRFWSLWGLSAGDIAKAVSFSAASFGIGIITVGGVVAVLEPASTAHLLHLPFASLKPVGLLLLTVTALYVWWSARRSRPLRIGPWEIPVPPPRLAVAQLLVAAIDWSVAAAVLYVLLPTGHGLGYVPFLGIFVLVQFAGLVSHVPGGLGVVEALMLLLLRPYFPADEVLASLLAYRAVFYLLPFVVAVGLLAAHEAWRQRRRARTVATAAGRWWPHLVPQLLAVSTLLTGALMLFSGATPALRGRLALLDRLFPLWLVEASHFTASLAGTMLVLLGWALWRRLDAAYPLTISVLLIAITTSLLKGLDWEEAVVAGALLLAFLPSRRHFHRRAALFSEPPNAEWLVAVIAVFATAAWLGLFAYRHVDYTSQLWWRFTLRGDAPRFMRGMVGGMTLLFMVGVMRLLRAARQPDPQPSLDELDRAAGIVTTSAEAAAGLALLGDKSLLFNDAGTGFIMYDVEGRSWVAMGDPVGPAREAAELAWRFHEMADRNGGWTVFYEAGTHYLPIYIDLGLSLQKVGEEAIVPLQGFSLEGPSRRTLRRAVRQAEKEGCGTEIIPAAGVGAVLPELRQVSDAWLRSRNTREKRFSVGRFDEAYLSRTPVAIVRRGHSIVAFANLWPGDGRHELSVDLMRYGPEAPESVMTYLFAELLLYGSGAGYERFSLGMAPLAGLDPRRESPLWNRMGHLVYRHGEHFYNFRGLREYKEKFDPIWEPRFLASPGGLQLPRIVANVAALISGSLRGAIAK